MNSNSMWRCRTPHLFIKILVLCCQSYRGLHVLDQYWQLHQPQLQLQQPQLRHQHNQQQQHGQRRQQEQQQQQQTFAPITSYNCTDWLLCTKVDNQQCLQTSAQPAANMHTQALNMHCKNKRDIISVSCSLVIAALLMHIFAAARPAARLVATVSQRGSSNHISSSIGSELAAAAAPSATYEAIAAKRSCSSSTC